MSARGIYYIKKGSASWIELLNDLCQDWKEAVKLTWSNNIASNTFFGASTNENSCIALHCPSLLFFVSPSFAFPAVETLSSLLG
jgi:hypothetical protein